MYEYSTKLDAEKHRYDGLARMIPTAKVARMIRFYPPDPPNLRTIFSVQKNSANAETCAASHAEPFAVARAELRADVGADIFAEVGAESGAAPAGRPLYRRCGVNLTCSSSGATCKQPEQVAPLELHKSVVDG